MNAKKFFIAAKENNIEPFELVNHTSSSISIKVFGDDLEDYTIANDSGISCRGIFEGKIGTFSSDRTDSKVVPLAIDAVKSSAKYGHEGNADFFIEKGLKYKRVSAYSKSVEAVSPAELIELAKKISKNVRNAEKRIHTCEVHFEKKASNTEFMNSKGLLLKEKSNFIVIYAAVDIKEGEETESAYIYDVISDYAAFDSAIFEEELLRRARSKLGSSSIASGKYDVVFDRELIPQLLGPLIDQLSAFEVQQKLSMFCGKKGEQVLSKKLTVYENPFVKGPFASAFDAEGMPTQKKELFTNGVLNTFLYDLETAKKDGVESTGNASKIAGNIRPGNNFIEVKKGRLSFEELLGKIENGLYITDLNGAHAGLNPQSGDYSLQAEGFLIENGKITKPVSLITVAGNLLKDFNKVIAVGNDSKVNAYGFSSPSIAIRKLVVSGQ